MPAWMKASQSSNGVVPGAQSSISSSAPANIVPTAPQPAANTYQAHQAPMYGRAAQSSYVPNSTNGYPIPNSNSTNPVASNRSRSRSRERNHDDGQNGERRRKSRFDRDDGRDSSAMHYGAAQTGFVNGSAQAPFARHDMPMPLQQRPQGPSLHANNVDIKTVLANALASSQQGMVGVGGAGMAASRPYRRLYVGGIPHCTEGEMQAFFNATISRIYMPGTHCLAAHVNNSDKRFAFLEFSTVDMATAAIQLDGVMFKGCQLKIRRPNDYNPAGQPPPTGPPILLNVSSLGLISSTVPDGPNKVFVGGLPHGLTEDQLRELLTAFGPLKGLHLVKDAGAVNNKGYAFCEYVDPAVTDVVCAALHNMSLGDKQLTVRRATGRSGGVDPLQQAALMGAGLHVGVGGMPSLVQGGMAGAMALPVQLGIPSHMPSRPPTRLLRLQGMCTEADLTLPPQDWRDLVEDIQSGLAGHGAIVAMHVPRVGPYAGNVYVLYADLAAAQVAARAVAGQTFDNRVIPVEYEPEDRLAEIQGNG